MRVASRSPQLWRRGWVRVFVCVLQPRDREKTRFLGHQGGGAYDEGHIRQGGQTRGSGSGPSSRGGHHAHMLETGHGRQPGPALPTLGTSQRSSAPQTPCHGPQPLDVHCDGCRKQVSKSALTWKFSLSSPKVHKSDRCSLSPEKRLLRHRET